MTATTTTQYNAVAKYEGHTPVGTTLPFENLNEPGCYICNWSGHLMRVPEDGVAPGRSPLINVVGAEPLFVTKICDNPYVPLTKARMVACNLDIAVNF